MQRAACLCVARACLAAAVTTAHRTLRSFRQCESSAKPMRNQCETPVRNLPRMVNYSIWRAGCSKRKMVVDIIYSLFDRPRARLCCNLQYGEGFALGFRIGFALDSHWIRTDDNSASYPRTSDTRATSVAKQSKPKSEAHGNTDVVSDKVEPAVTTRCRLTHGMAVGSEHRNCSIAQTPGRKHESDNTSGTDEQRTCICSTS